ncbi:hypothetical protein Bca4012_099318 [Brassica carinata]
MKSVLTTAEESVNHTIPALNLPITTDFQATTLDPVSYVFGYVKSTIPQTVNPRIFSTIEPKSSSPLRTNLASSPPRNPIFNPAPLLPQPANVPSTSQSPLLPNKSKLPLPKTLPPRAPPPSWAQKAKVSIDRSLKRLAPTSTSPGGKPRVSVPNAVFQRGAELHKEYLVGTFLGKMLDYGPIQSVLNFMWGRGAKLEIHLQPQKRSFLVRIPNEFIRTKALEKRLWYVGTSMLHVSQWSSSVTCVIPEIESIPLWAHLSGVSFDLRTKEGLSLAADLTKPLPTLGELIRQNGDIIPIDIEYPWIPPSCDQCGRIGHIEKDCIYSPKVPLTESPIAQSSGQTSQVVVPDPLIVEMIPDPPDHDEDISDTSDTIVAATSTLNPPDLDLPSLSNSAIPSIPNPPDHDEPQHMSIDTPSSPIAPSSPPSKPPPPSSSSPPSPPSPLDSQSITFSTSTPKGSYIIGLPATYAPTFGSYITTQQALAFNAPSITLPPQYCCPSRPPLLFPTKKPPGPSKLNPILSLSSSTAPRSHLLVTDNWSPFGRLEDFLTPTISRRMGVPASATLSNINSNGNWLVQSPRTENQLLVQVYLSTLVLTEEEDNYEWVVDGNQWEKYKTGAVYDLLKRHGPRVNWYQTIWSKGGIPKHNFLAWLFTLNRCPTRDRLINLGLSVDPNCMLCNTAPESRDHLLFQCSYSWEVWSQTATRCQITPPRDWASLLPFMNGLTLPKNHKKLILLAWQCTIYLLWSERNSRLHRGCFRSS